MTGIPDELVEKVARALYDHDREVRGGALGPYPAWDRALDDDHEGYRIQADLALGAVGLPALLERVEAAEGDRVGALREAADALVTMRDMSASEWLRLEADRLDRNATMRSRIQTPEGRETGAATATGRLEAELEVTRASVGPIAETAWNEGFTAGHVCAKKEQGDSCDDVNPYRAALTEGEKP